MGLSLFYAKEDGAQCMCLGGAKANKTILISNKVSSNILKDSGFEKVLPIKNTEAINKILHHEHNFQAVKKYSYTGDYKIGFKKHFTLCQDVDDKSSLVANYTSQNDLSLVDLPNNIAYDFSRSPFPKKMTFLTPFHFIKSEDKLNIHRPGTFYKNDTREILAGSYSEDSLRKLYNNLLFVDGETFIATNVGGVHTFEKIKVEELIKALLMKTKGTPFGADLYNFYNSAIVLRGAGLVGDYHKFACWKSFGYESKTHKIWAIVENQESQTAYFSENNAEIDQEWVNELISKLNTY